MFLNKGTTMIAHGVYIWDRNLRKYSWNLISRDLDICEERLKEKAKRYPKNNAKPNLYLIKTDKVNLRSNLTEEEIKKDFIILEKV